MGLANNYSKANNHGLPEGQVQKLPTEVEGRKMQKPYLQSAAIRPAQPFWGVTFFFLDKTLTFENI
jgi:hypothetical protein